MEIRKAEIRDSLAIKDLVFSLSHFYMREDNLELPAWFVKALDEREFERRISSDEFLNLVIDINGMIAGYISIKNKEHLYHLFISKDHQGQGLSRQLWARAISECKSQSYTVRSSLFAVPVYERFGFLSVGAPDSKDGLEFQAMEYRVKC